MTGSNMPRPKSQRTRQCTTTSSRNVRSLLVTAGHEHSLEIFSSTRASCCVPLTSARSLTAKESRLFDSARESLELELFSTEPIYDDYEILRLTDSLTDFVSKFGADDPLVKKVLAEKSPHDRAVELVSGTKLKDVAVRKELYGKDAAALQAVHDPMIDLARLVDGPAREAKKIYDAQEEFKKQAYSQIAKARFAIEGTDSYPDATFTLRLSYGTVRGYEQDGKQISAFTD